MELVGRTLRGRMNGRLFFVSDKINESGKEYYRIVDLATRRVISPGKDWFEKGIMQNLEIVN